MRPEVRAKLDAAERLHHARGALVGVLIVAAMLTGLLELSWTTGLEQRPVLGVVRFGRPYVNEQTGQRGLHLQVELENSRLVNAESFPLLALTPPPVGTTVKLTERRSFTGYHSYIWSPAAQ